MISYYQGVIVSRKSWMKNSQKTENSDVKMRLKRKLVDSLIIKLDQATIKNDRLTSLGDQKKIELDSLQKDFSHAHDTINHRDEMINVLQSHIAQLTQRISQPSLEPGEEEIKKKGWWQFWK